MYYCKETVGQELWHVSYVRSLSAWPAENVQTSDQHMASARLWRRHVTVKVKPWTETQRDKCHNFGPTNKKKLLSFLPFSSFVAQSNCQSQRKYEAKEAEQQQAASGKFFKLTRMWPDVTSCGRTCQGNDRRKIKTPCSSDQRFIIFQLIVFGVFLAHKQQQQVAGKTSRVSSILLF